MMLLKLDSTNYAKPALGFGRAKIQGDALFAEAGGNISPLVICLIFDNLEVNGLEKMDVIIVLGADIRRSLSVLMNQFDEGYFRG